MDKETECAQEEDFTNILDGLFGDFESDENKEILWSASTGLRQEPFQSAAAAGNGDNDNGDDNEKQNHGNNDNNPTTTGTGTESEDNDGDDDHKKKQIKKSGGSSSSSSSSSSNMKQSTSVDLLENFADKASLISHLKHLMSKIQKHPIPLNPKHLLSR